MSTQKEYALIAILATAALVGILPAFSQSPADTGVANANTFSSGTESQILPISVSTDKNVYDRQSTINVTGHVLEPIIGQTVTMKVSDAIGNVVEIHQLTVDNNGDFQTTINTSSPLWTASGTYTIYAQYGAQQGLRTSTTEFTIPGGGETSCTSQQLSATLGSELHCIDYSIDGGIASGATLDTSSKSLTVSIRADNDGQITLNIPRSVLDSKAGEKDKSNMRYAIVLIISLFIISALFIPILGQMSSPSPPTAAPITVNTDKPSYLLGDTIVISGSVKSPVQNTQLSIQIFDPNNNLVHVDQIDVSKDGRYTDTIKAVGVYWKINGNYTVKVQYALPGVTAQTTFTFQSSVPLVSNVFEVKDPNSQQTFGVNYTITGGTVKNISIDVQSISLIVSVNSTSDGTITLQIPRALVDAKTNSGQHDAFIIIIDE